MFASIVTISNGRIFGNHFHISREAKHIISALFDDINFDDHILNIKFRLWDGKKEERDEEQKVRISLPGVCFICF